MTRAQLRDWLDNFPEAREIIQRLLDRFPEDETATPPSSGSVGQTACDHPYFPMRPGATWTYQTDTGSFTWTVDSVEGTPESATAVMTFNVADVSGTYNWTCTAAGGLVSYATTLAG
jgi:hypothetical protein